ncbi:MAG: hypothetical protein CVU60_11985 [Deltaproteobacteria bacterium HGW-Deltaproteobacteria-18]|nr:MAG: hypothetical protein CVU60_11985 [Deltaproteobacteria bacterium HGW-Deltaproteobacteria-18]
MSIGLNMNQAQDCLVRRQDGFKMNELGDERAITIGQKGQIVKAEIMDAPARPQHKPHKANTGLEGLFRATIDKCDWWHSAGKLRRTQDAIEVNLGRMAGKFVNLQALAGKSGLSDDVVKQKNLLIDGISKELSAFETEVDSLVRSYGLNREDTEKLFLQRLINGLKKDNPSALNSMKAAVAVVARMPDENPVTRDHGALVRQFDKLLHASLPDVVAEPVDQRSGLQKLGDVFKGLFGSKEQRVGQLLREKLNGLEQLCKTGAPEMEEFTDQLRLLREGLNPETELTMEKFDAVREELDTIIGATIKRGKEIAEKALETESAKMTGQLAVDKYQPQLVSAEEANRDLSKLFLYKNATLEQTKSLQSPLDEKADDLIRNYIRSQNQSPEMPVGARAVAQIAVNSVKDMTLKFVAAGQELKSIEVELSAITLARQLAAKGDKPPAGVDGNSWHEACSVMTRHLLEAPGSLISAKDVPALNLIKTHAAQFTEGLQGVAVQSFEKLFTRLDATTSFTVTVPKPSAQQIEKFKQTGEMRMQEDAERFGRHMQEYRNSAPKTGISELDNRLAELRTPLTLNPEKLDEASLRGTLSELAERITDIKAAYSYEMASALSGIDGKQARLDQRTKLFATLNTELQGLMRLEADLQGMINMHAMGQLASEGLDMLRQSCPEGVDRGAWESDCNAIVDFIMEHPHEIPGQETVAMFERLLDTLNKSLSTDSVADQQKVELYKSLKDDVNEWRDWGFTVGMGRDSLNNMGHMNEVLESVSKMTTARIRISDTINLMQDSFIALTKAGFSHADELRSNISEYTKKLMHYADTMSSNKEMTLELRGIRQEAQESLSKTIHSFFPAMEFLAEQEQAYLLNPDKFTVAQTQQITDLRATMLNAYSTVFDVARNVGTLGLDAARGVSDMLGVVDLTESAVRLSDVDVSPAELREAAALEQVKIINECGQRSREVGVDNPLISVTGSMMEESKALMEFRIQMGKEQQITKLFTLTRDLAVALVDAKARNLDPAIAKSIERLFSEHVLSPGETTWLDHYIIPEGQKDANDFGVKFEKLHIAVIHAFSHIQARGLNVKSTQARINAEAQKHLTGCVEIAWHPLDTKSLRKSLRVVSSHDIDGKMSRILIDSSLTKEPRWYDVSLNKDTLTFTPTDDKSGKGVFTAPVANGNARFPML